MLDLPYLLSKYNLKPWDVLHIGTSKGQEAPTYKQVGIKQMIFVEAIYNVFCELCDNTRDYEDTECYHACISDKDGDQVDFHIASNEGQSSSILNFGNHQSIHPEVSFIATVPMTTQRIDSLITGKDFGNWFLNIDLQGA